MHLAPTSTILFKKEKSLVMMAKRLVVVCHAFVVDAIAMAIKSYHHFPSCCRIVQLYTPTPQLTN
jgi:hypothetical protein